MNIVYKIMFFVSISLVVAAIVITAVFGLHTGVDFRGGSVMEVTFKNDRPAPTDIATVVKSLGDTGDVSVSPAGDKSATIRLNSVDEAKHQQIVSALSAKFGELREDRFDSIGPTVGNELKTKSIYALILLLLSIVIYIAFVFRGMSRVLSPFAMGVAAIVALIHDVTIPVGVFALLGHFLDIEISAVFVAAALTILGYSISDTVVVFDRVRENVLRLGSKEKFGTLVHKSVMQTLARSLNTNLTVLLTLFAIFFFGGASIKFFALALIVGIFLGAYSSIFVAAPVLVWWSGRKRK